MQTIEAIKFTQGSVFSDRSGFVVNWPSSDDLMHDDRGYLSRVRRPFAWGIHSDPDLVPALSCLGIAPTAISFVRNKRRDPGHLRDVDKDEIFVPSSIFKPDHTGAVRTVIVGELNGTLKPPHIEIEVNTRAICAMANVQAHRLKAEKRDERFALAALAITNRLIAQQLLRSTRIIQANNGMKNPTQVLRENYKYEPRGMVAESIVRTMSAASLIMFEESIYATNRLASYDNDVTANNMEFSRVRSTIRQRPIFVPARRAGTLLHQD